MTADPVGNGCVGNWTAPEPVWIKLDFDLFEADGQGRIAVARAGAVENGRRPLDEALSEIRLVQIAPEDEDRQHWPIMRMLRYSSATEIDHSPDDETAGFVQDVHRSRPRSGAPPDFERVRTGC